jgi:hypothetical protein
MSSRKDGDTMNRLMRVTLLTFVVSLVVWGLNRSVGRRSACFDELDADVAKNRGLRGYCLGAGDARAARVCGLGAAQTLVQTCALPVGTGIGDPHLRRAPDRLRGGPDGSGCARRDAAGGRPERLGAYSSGG